MSVTVLVTQARFSLPGGKPWVELSRFLVNSFQFSFGISIPLFIVASLRDGSRARIPAMPSYRGCRAVNAGILTAAPVRLPDSESETKEQPNELHRELNII